jgi:hypothetical protein
MPVVPVKPEFKPSAWGTLFRSVHCRVAHMRAPEGLPAWPAVVGCIEAMDLGDFASEFIHDVLAELERETRRAAGA